MDFYLLHSLSRNTWRWMKELGVVELLEEAQRRGRIRWFGFSFHDSFSAFEEILRARSWDLCQIQLNYMDTEHQAGLRGYALAEALGIPVVVMEPVKGGSLAQLPDDACAPLLRLDPEATPASWALRWAASLPMYRWCSAAWGVWSSWRTTCIRFRTSAPWTAGNGRP